jgi:hypothetical protein
MICTISSHQSISLTSGKDSRARAPYLSEHPGDSWRELAKAIFTGSTTSSPVPPAQSSLTLAAFGRLTSSVDMLRLITDRAAPMYAVMRKATLHFDQRSERLQTANCPQTKTCASGAGRSRQSAPPPCPFSFKRLLDQRPLVDLAHTLRGPK